MARRAGGRAVPVDGRDPERLLAAITPRTRVVALCNPNDPTGEHAPLDRVRALANALPERVWLLLDQALADYVEGEEADAALGLPRTLVFRTFSKAWGLAGLRCGYAIGPEGAAELLEAVAPPLGVGALAQAGALAALRREAVVRDRIALVVRERRRVLAVLEDGAVVAQPSQANFLWLRAPGLAGGELHAGLARLGVRVAAGGPLGAEDHVRAAVQSPQASERLLTALAVLTS
jgi:histidinol-phosphate aminotransferase